MENKTQLDDLTMIRNLMEKSTKFMSLSGLSGIFIGIYALIGAAVAYWFLEIEEEFIDYERIRQVDFLLFVIIDAGLVLFFSLATTFILSKRKSSKMGIGFWNKPAKKLVFSIAIPLAIGGAFILILYYHNILYLIAPATLIFYGMALMNASKESVKELFYMGLIEVVLGFTACFDTHQGLFYWAFGFGILHILYGIIIHLKYDSKDKIR